MRNGWRHVEDTIPVELSQLLVRLSVMVLICLSMALCGFVSASQYPAKPPSGPGSSSTNNITRPLDRIEVGEEYVLRRPDRFQNGILTNGSPWCWMALENLVAVSRVTVARYNDMERAVVQEEGSHCAKVRLLTGDSKGSVGWVAHELIQQTPEKYQAQERRRKEAEFKRKVEAERRKRLQVAEEKYVTSLPKLFNRGNPVIVATSTDCARNLQSVLEFGRRNGTGVDFRRKLKELIELECAITLPSMTPVEVTSRSSDFVGFRVYSGPNRGKVGVALKEHILQ